MAQDFDFTVRATDDQGSFADRNFSITVNNTVVARFVAVSSSAVLHSNDGKEWIRNDALSAMQDVTFGNGRWMIPRTNMTTYQSTDGVNWTEQAYTYTNPGSMLNSSRALYTRSLVGYVRADALQHMGDHVALQRRTTVPHSLENC